MSIFRRKHKKDKGSIKEPEALAHYYMDTMQCYNYYELHQDCMSDFQKKWVGRGKLH